MNLAQVIDYNPETREYKLCPERAREAPRPRTSFDPPVVREHHARPMDPLAHRPCVKRPLRAAGKEVLSVLKRAGRPLTFKQLSGELPHVGEATLQVRLSNNLIRGGYIERTGSKRDYLYTFVTTMATS